jgi:hypothetical protein
VTAEVKGITKVQSWRDALDAVQKRHPILSTSIKRNEEGQPALYQVDTAPIPLRVVDGSVQGLWELELDREMRNLRCTEKTMVLHRGSARES